MNIFKIFEKANDLEKKTLLTQGFQRTDFNNSNLSLDSLFKEFINLFVESDKSLIYTLRETTLKLNPQNGIIKTVSQNNDEEGKTKKLGDKVITFGSDLKIVLNNLVGLMGYEFGTNLLLISLYPVLLKQIIEDIPKAKNYKEIKHNINIICNMYNIGDGKILEYNNNDADDFNNTFNFNNIENVLNNKFREIYSKIDIRIKNNNNINFDSDKQDVYNKLLSIYNNTTYNTYYIKNVDNLCIELGKFKPCYDNYFIKMWELLFKETYCDYYEYENVYPRFEENIEEDKEKIVIPFINLINSYVNKLDKGHTIINQIYKHINTLEQYFKLICKKSMMTVNSDMDANTKIIKVVVQEVFYEHLASIFVNMLVVLAKNIVISHEFINNMNKFVKLQFIEIFNGLKFSTPALLNYSESQLMVLHYIIMTKQNLETMMNNDQNKQVRKRKKTTKTNNNNNE